MKKIIYLLIMMVVATYAEAACLGPCSSTGDTIVDDLCPTLNDYGTPWYVDRPDESCCSTANCTPKSSSTTNDYKRWTPPRIAAREGAAIAIGSVEFASVPTINNLPPQSSTCFGLSVQGGLKTGANLELLENEIVRIANERGAARPLIFRENRFDDFIVSQLDTQLAFTPLPVLAPMLLRNRRSWANHLAWHTGTGACPGTWPTCSAYSHCRAPTNPVLDLAFDYDTGVGSNDGGCDDVTGNEYLWTLATQTRMRDFDDDLEEKVVYDIFYRDTATVRGPVAVLTNLASDLAIQWQVDYFYETMKLEPHIIGPSLVMKDQFYTSGNSVNVEHWADSPLDALGGTAGTDTIANTVANGVASLYSGPPYIKEGDTGCDAADGVSDGTYDPNIGGVGVGGCAFTWPYYIYGMNKLVRALYNHVPRIPALVYMAPVQLQGCGLDYVNGPSFDDGNCLDYYDDNRTVESECTAFQTPHTACLGNNECYLDCNEGAMFRELIQYAGYVRFDTQGKKPNAHVIDPPPGTVSGGIGINSGIGITYAQAEAMLMRGSPKPIWVRPIDTFSSPSWGTAPVLCRNPQEPQPAPLTP